MTPSVIVIVPCRGIRHLAVHFGPGRHGIRKYWSSACPKCPIRNDCTTSNYRRLMRWEHEAVIERMQRRLDRMPQAGRLRRQTVEHTFARSNRGWARRTPDEAVTERANGDEPAGSGVQPSA